MRIICILIPIHNRIEMTKQGLNSLFSALRHFNENGLSQTSYKVVVIDDGSKDGSKEWIKEHYKDCEILIGDGNLWWSGAINKGIEYALTIDKLTHVILWNDDT